MIGDDRKALHDHEARERASRNGQPPGQVRAITASSVTAANVKWLWRGWLPLRMVALLAGQPGFGKTTLATRLAADISRGELDGALAGVPADVLVVSYEDAIAETLVPRLTAADADLDRVHFVGCSDVGRTLDLTRHLPDIDRLAREHGARLLYIDPLVAGMPAGEVSSHRDQDVRSVLAPIAMLAERQDLAVLATMHFSKSATSALLGVGGSIGFVGAARSVLVFGADPTDDRGAHGPARVLAHGKCNVGRLQRSRQVAILSHVIDPFGDDPIETSTALIGDECEVSADELVQTGGRKEGVRGQALRFLRDLLADGPHAAKEVFRLAEDDGLPEKTVRRAKDDLDVETYQEGRQWWWRLPERVDDELEEES